MWKPVFWLLKVVRQILVPTLCCPAFWHCWIFLEAGTWQSPKDFFPPRLVLFSSLTSRALCLLIAAAQDVALFFPLALTGLGLSQQMSLEARILLNCCFLQPWVNFRQICLRPQLRQKLWHSPIYMAQHDNR